MSKIYRFLALPLRVQFLYLSTTLRLIAMKAGLLIMGFGKLQRCLGQQHQLHQQSQNINSENMNELASIILAIKRISTFLSPLKINCLPQALVGQRLLYKKGYIVMLKIGVHKSKIGQLEAHAWLEHEGKVILGDMQNLRRFKTFPYVEVEQRGPTALSIIK